MLRVDGGSGEKGIEDDRNDLRNTNSTEPFEVSNIVTDFISLI